MGIKIEHEHTTNKMIALEITMDHLEEIPDYYTRLQEMEEEAEEDMEEVKESPKK
jgi:predicted ATP-grasp superfamily ATP-dependent carboligase